MIRPIPALLILCLSALVFYAFMVLVAHAKWRPEYENNPPEVQKWFSSQHNALGEWCCNEADGHRYYGDYTVNPDGSVTVEGNVIPKERVLTAPNPTGSAVWWFLEVEGGKRTYCFAIGGGV
jgi:hypothetical protein